MITYSAIAGSWPNTLQTVSPRGTAGRSTWSSPAAIDCSRRNRGAAGNPERQIWPTTMSASASSGAKPLVSLSPARNLGRERCLLLRQDARCDRGSEMAEKQSFDQASPGLSGCQRDCRSVCAAPQRVPSARESGGVANGRFILPTTAEVAFDIGCQTATFRRSETRIRRDPIASAPWHPSRSNFIATQGVKRQTIEPTDPWKLGNLG
jgi:hypothetical protein